jgi:beta-lactamase superfamily II metal-dependent hydrolase
MADYWEVDFLQVNSSRSGDAITARYQVGSTFWVHVIDGGYAADAERIAGHIKNRYGTNIIDHMVVTHPDQDHAEGLAKLAELCEVRNLWMLRPWHYANELMSYFTTYTSVDRLASKLRSSYPFIDELEKVAIKNKIPISEPFQGANIGLFKVLAPSPQRWAHLVIDSDKTPENADTGILGNLFEMAKSAVRFIKAGWGSEKFSAEDTSNENEMSVIQYLEFNGRKVLLTGDAGRAGMTEAAAYAPQVGLILPRVTDFQAPHHGGRRNVNSEILDTWLGPIQPSLPAAGSELFTAVISASGDDPAHPRKAVRRGLLHRGAKLLTTEQHNIWIHGGDYPARADYYALPNNPYPDEQEE